MGDLRKKEISQEDIKKLENTNITVEVTSPEEEHKKAVHYRKKLLAWGLVLLIVIEGAGAVTLGQKIVSDNLQKEYLGNMKFVQMKKYSLQKDFIQEKRILDIFLVKEILRLKMVESMLASGLIIS